MMVCVCVSIFVVLNLDPTGRTSAGVSWPASTRSLFWVLWNCVLEGFCCQRGAAPLCPVQSTVEWIAAWFFCFCHLRCVCRT